MQFSLRSILLTITLCAVTLGLWKFMVAGGPLVRSIVQMVLVGMYAGAVGYGMGWFFPLHAWTLRSSAARVACFALIGFCLLLSAYAFWAYHRWTWVNLGDLHWPRPLPYPDSLTLAVYEWLVSAGSSPPSKIGFRREFHTMSQLIAVVQFAALAAGAAGCGLLLPHPRKSDAAKGNVA